MTNQQFDYLLALVVKQNRLIENLVDKISVLSLALDKLSTKTIIVSDIDKQVEQLKIDVASLKDEQGA